MRIAAKKRRSRKQQNGKDIIIPSSEQATEKTRHGNDNHVRDRVGRDHPRNILDRRAERRAHVRDRYVHDRRVDQLDHRGCYHGDDDDPFFKTLFCHGEVLSAKVS